MELSDIDHDAVEVLRQQIRTEEESNRLKQRELLILQRREELIWNAIEETTKLRAEVQVLIDYFKMSALTDDALQDTFTGLSERLERLERIAVLQLGMRGNQDEVQQTREELRGELEQRHLKKLLERHYRTLRKLEEREAEFGGNAPIEICNQLEDIREKITRLEEKLK